MLIGFVKYMHLNEGLLCVLNHRRLKKDEAMVASTCQCKKINLKNTFLIFFC